MKNTKTNHNNEQISISEANDRMRVMLDATPLACRLMRKNEKGEYEIFDCNEEAIKLFGYNSKQEYIEQYFDTYPKYQPNGRTSREEAYNFVDRAITEGRCVVDFTFKTKDGALIPAEVTLVRVKYEDEYVIAGYTRDMREYKRMMKDISNRDSILNTMNQVAVILLEAANEEHFEESLLLGMQLIGKGFEADTVQIWSNEERDDALYCVLKYQWLSDAGEKAPPVAIGTGLQYSEHWKALFMRGESVDRPVARLTEEDRDTPDPITSAVTIPLFYRGEFWGVFCVDNYSSERCNTEGNVGLLRSAALMLVNAINRNLQSAENRIQLTRLNLAVKSAKIGLWDVNVKRGDSAYPISNVTWTDDFRKILGFTDEHDFPNVDSSFHNSIHPDDRERTDKAFFDHYYDKSGQTPYDVEFRMTKKNGECAYIHAYGETIRDENGDPIFIAGAMVDVTETKNAIEEIERQRIQAEKANKAKSNFLSTMSHEIRSPMNVILGLAEIQLQKESLDGDTRTAFEQIHISGDLLLGIINDILDLSKIEAGKLELTLENYEIASLISDTAQLNMLQIGSKPIEFVLNLDKNIPSQLVGDKLRVKQILNNLLSNAFKYTSKGTVELSMRTEPSNSDKDKTMLIVSVSDTGHGMTNEQVDKLFEEYARFNEQSNRTTEGTGLGMSITRNLVDMMDGEFFVESTPGKGSLFTIHLQQGKVGDDILGEEIVENLRHFRTSNRTHMKRVRITREPMPYGSVLIVDDVDTNIYVARGLLAPYELKIESVNSGFEAIEKIRNGSVYDIIFMDHMMPGMDGIEATGYLREMGYDRPIVALTANAVVGQADIFLENGFDSFVSKPIDIRHLNTVLNKLIRDRTPPEIVEAARKQREANAANSYGDAGAEHILEIEYMPEPIMDDRITEVFLRDAMKVLTIFEELSARDNYSNDIGTYIATVHGIKSALANIGQKKLSDAAARLEDAGREKQIEVIKSRTPVFVDSLRTLVEMLTVKAGEGDGEINIGDEDSAFLREQLVKIKSACEEYRKTDAKDILEDLMKKSWSKPTKDFLDNINKNLLHSNFEEIANTIGEFIKT